HGRWRGEVVAYRKDGTPVCVELITVALRGERGGITGYLGIHRDITERRRMPVTREDIIGRSVWDLFPDARGTETESRLRAAMDATEPVEFQMYFGPT